MPAHVLSSRPLPPGLGLLWSSIDRVWNEESFCELDLGGGLVHGRCVALRVRKIRWERGGGFACARASVELRYESIVRLKGLSIELKSRTFFLLPRRGVPACPTYRIVLYVSPLTFYCTFLLLIAKREKNDGNKPLWLGRYANLVGKEEDVILRVIIPFAATRKGSL